jgi:hypothetical protein
MDPPDLLLALLSIDSMPEQTKSNLKSSGQGFPGIGNDKSYSYIYYKVGELLGVLG